MQFSTRRAKTDGHPGRLSRRSHQAVLTRCAAFGAQAGGKPKTLHVMRHGASTMNQYLALHRYGSPHQEPLRDPMLVSHVAAAPSRRVFNWCLAAVLQMLLLLLRLRAGSSEHGGPRFDAPLSAEGERLAAAAGRKVLALHPPPEVVLVSPLTRCLQTAALAVEPWARSAGVACQVEPGLRERLTLSSEVGRPPQVLQPEFPSFVLPRDMPEVWWYSGPDGISNLPPNKAVGESEVTSQNRSPASLFSPVSTARMPTIVPEPKGEYEARLARLAASLAARPETTLLLVSHWGVLKALTGLELEAGQLATVEDWRVPDALRL